VHIAYGHGSVFLWQRCNKFCTSGFADDVIFSYNLGGVKLPQQPRCNVVYVLTPPLRDRDIGCVPA